VWKPIFGPSHDGAAALSVVDRLSVEGLFHNQSYYDSDKKKCIKDMYAAVGQTSIIYFNSLITKTKPDSSIESISNVI